jgi:transcriptional regulator with XRE-family HTH domain
MEKSIYTKDYATFLGCLRQARKDAGLTQEQLAAKIGTTQSVVSKCERGERRIDVVELRVICKSIGVSLREFIDSLESAIEAGA